MYGRAAAAESYSKNNIKHEMNVSISFEISGRWICKITQSRLIASPIGDI